MGKRVPDEFVLLCETCGYDIEGLPEDGACPECGRAIRTSLPETRPGSPWQSGPSVGSLAATWHRTLTKSRITFDRIRPDADPRGLHERSLLTASTFGLVGALIIQPLFEPQWIRSASSPMHAASLITAVAVGICMYISLELLTFIEERGIRFWGPRRGWRITPAIARTICAHASVGWVLGSVLMVAGHLLGLYLAQFPHRHNLGIFRGPIQLAPITLPILGFLAGMLTFEILVYIGMSRMKFANREKPPPPLDASMPPASMPSSSTGPPPGSAT